MIEQPKPTPEDLCRSYLLCFATAMYPNYQIAKHHQAIAAHLEALEKRQIKKLIITMPPRMGKTLLASELFASFYLGRNPTHEIIFSTYSKERAMDIGLKVKTNIESEKYQSIFNTRAASGSKSKSQIVTTDGGALYSVGVGGAVVGRGANLFLMDDLIKSRAEAESEGARRILLEWFRGVAFTRLMPGGVICLINTRWHTQDITGFILEEWGEDWVHLDLPAICEQETDFLGRQKGDALWPEFFNVKDLDDIRRVIGTREFSAQYQQQPVGAKGSLVQLDWFQRYSKDPDRMQFKRIIQSWDTAYESGKRNDPSVCTVWGQDAGSDGKIYLLDVWRKRADYPDVRKAIYMMYQKWPKTSKILIEDRTSGKSIIKDLQQTNLPIIPIKDQASKEVRLIAVSGMIEAGKIYLPEKASWLYDYESEMSQFPVGKHDDQVDSTSQALDYLKKPFFLSALRPMFWK